MNSTLVHFLLRLFYNTCSFLCKDCWRFLVISLGFIVKTPPTRLCAVSFNPASVSVFMEVSLPRFPGIKCGSVRVVSMATNFQSQEWLLPGHFWKKWESTQGIQVMFEFQTLWAGALQLGLYSKPWTRPRVSISVLRGEDTALHQDLSFGICSLAKVVSSSLLGQRFSV